MSDAVDIRSGGAVAVDTASLRHAAGVCVQFAAECAIADGWLRAAQDAARDAGLPLPFPIVPLGDIEAHAEHLASALRERAMLYEAVERAAADGFRSLGASDRRTPIDAEAEAALDVWRAGIHREVERQLAGAVAPLGTMVALLGPALVGIVLVPSTLTWLVREMALGLVPRDAPPLRRRAHAVTVTVLSRAAAEAPTSLAELAERMPGAGDTRVRVEEYRTRSGGREFVVYIAGTQSWAPGGPDPWDMTSNLELYLRENSASYAAVEKALAHAGAVPGDAVNIAGHSQGGMLGSHLARQGGFEVGWVVTFGSPVQAVLPDDVRQVTIRHTDDPVAALAGGGAPIVAGSADSFVVERLADPRPRIGDLEMSVHQMDEYRTTAAIADDSGDPRVRDFHTALLSLGGAVGGAAVSGTAVVYGARRQPTETPAARRRP